MISVLRKFSIDADFFVPRRACEGYGLSSEIIERILSEKKYDTVIALDCGTNSEQEVEFLKKNAIDVLIVDHHQAKMLPVAKCCIVNPHVESQQNDGSGKLLCTVGLVFKLCSALLRTLAKKNDRRASNYSLKNDLDLVALGTIGDMAHLIHENRIFCKFGLKILSGKSRRPGIEALCRAADIPSGTNIKQSDVSFKLCPRLNACGRLADAVLPINMLLSSDFNEAITYAYELDETNRERQLIEKEMTLQAEELVKAHYAESAGLVLYNGDWHSGVVGIVSGKFARDYARPCIVLGNERGIAKGSGRSPSNTNLIDVLCDCVEYLETWGGHPYAVGVSILPKNIDAFREKFNEAVKRHSNGPQLAEPIEYSAELDLEEIRGEFMEKLDLLQPFGQRNQEPIFLISNRKIDDLPESFGAQKSHIKFWLTDRHSKRILVIGWHKANSIPPIGTALDFTVTINYEMWNKISSIHLTMVDWRVARHQR
ncbi:MAG: DHH family phosphoesterase, partial [Puniceicoccales bacterium]|jgi:single-stranded-DNA-specific exonuclease|nr:DHH family phosphoesterase [Puniceicoccales bacterium]